ncbi:hypothetical protein L6452_31841 [Arctium lappa]|uniref:Uncharacterized protein n=1 Tax=Arctium lappa TaxID=4217 RepID=A0ACB8Z472_ARCLA|nr:hypothetical protein L6452_31841 [Arctium lappa]
MDDFDRSNEEEKGLDSRACIWVWMTMTLHSGSSKLCANIKCRKPIQVTRSQARNAPTVALAFFAIDAHPPRSISPLLNPGAPFRMGNFEGPATGSITVPGPTAARTPCLLNSSNTKPEVIVSDQPTPASRLGERKNNTIGKRSSQIRASQIIKDKTTLGIEHSRSRKLLGNVLISRVPATPMAAKNQLTNEVVIHNPFSRVSPATPMAVAARNQIPDHEKVSKMR